MTDPNRQILAAVLEWSLAMGADAAVDEQATDWLAEGRGPPNQGFAMAGTPAESVEETQTGAGPSQRPATAPAQRSPVPSPARQPARSLPPQQSGARKFATSAPDVAAAQARMAAQGAESLEGLRAALETFEGCSLKATAKSLCFYRGAASAPLMIIGEAPGRDEDMEGRPFIGRAGQLLDRMLAAAGWSEADVHITNNVYWRPPGNRAPTPQETDVCRPFLERHIELVAPKVLLLLGGSAAKQILRTDEGILNVRGQWSNLEFGNLRVAAIASLHPAYLMLTPIAKSQAWRDFLSVKDFLKTAGG
jgi:uracil-DNA glycosylase family 4